ncbi:MAG: alpha/beta fold hydrolase [Gammaproteobacteria bacterium]|nr:alpha/beta fold hydrolase [Gammaproteobacteria bacterium]MCW5584206.1 alpha/beta fold hydrolase [Gammaproteobacteria bacterium]
MRKLKINDITMYYEVHGEGEPIVLVSGFGADHTIWYEVVDRLKNTYQVILLDNRGIGQTDVPAGAYSIEQMANDVIALCTHIGIRQAHFIGNSMGGYIVQMLAYQYPERVKSVVISNSATTAQYCFNLYLAAQLELIKANAPLISLIKVSCSWIFSYQFLSQPGVLDKLIQQNLENPYPLGVTGYEGQYAALKQFDSREWVEKINVPTMIIGADQDLIFNEKSTQSLANLIPGATYFCFANCGHLPFIEYPEKFVNLIQEYI